MKAKATALVDKPLWAEVKKLSALANVSASRVAEAGLRLVLLIARTGIPDDLGEVLAKHDPALLEALRDLCEAWRNA